MFDKFYLNLKVFFVSSVSLFQNTENKEPVLRTLYVAILLFIFCFSTNHYKKYIKLGKSYSYSTVTDLARFLGLSGFNPRFTEM